MDLIVGLPKIKNYNVIWVIFYHLTKLTHFIPISVNYSPEKLAKIYIKEIVKLHSMPMSIISDRDPQFTSCFLASFS